MTLNPSARGLNHLVCKLHVTFQYFFPVATTVQFDPEEYTVVEGEDARLRIILSGASTMEVTVVLNTQDGTASGEENTLVLWQ